jgi:hypothetical protein
VSGRALVKGIFGILGAPSFLGPSRDGTGNIHEDGVDFLEFLGLGMEFTLDGREGTEEGPYKTFRITSEGIEVRGER